MAEEILKWTLVLSGSSLMVAWTILVVVLTIRSIQEELDKLKK